MINKLISKTQVRLLEYDGNPSQDYKDGYCSAIHDVLDLEPIPTLGADEYEKFKVDYENRLKADMVAMLDQFDSEIQEQIAFMGDGEETNGMKRVDNLVKDKINSLKQSIWQDNYNGKKEWLDGTYEKTSD